MFCPECGYEYRHGFTVCADCGASLLKEPSQAAANESAYKDFVEVMDTPDILYIRIVASVLNSVGIDTYVLGEHFGGVYAGAFAVKLMASADRAEEAMDIIRDMDKKREGPISFDLDEEGTPPDDDFKGFYDDSDEEGLN